MSKKDINQFIRDVQRLEDMHSVRVGFITIDDRKRQLCSCKGIDPDDDLASSHLKALYICLKAFEEEKN